MTTSHDRLEALCSSLITLVAETERLEHRARASDDAPGCAVRLTSAEGSISTLVVENDGVVVTTLSADDHPEAGQGMVEDVLDVDLREGYDWDDVSCRSAAQLAGLLVKHMRRRTKEAAPEPGEEP